MTRMNANVFELFFNTGRIFEGVEALAALSAPTGPWVVIDGYHAFCAIDVDLGTVADRVFYLGGGYKYAMAGEGAAWTAIGALAGLLLGLAVSLVLVKVVNPQSFHWTMDLLVPWLRLAALGLAVVAAGTVTAYLTARRLAAQDAVRAVKEDW